MLRRLTLLAAAAGLALGAVPALADGWDHHGGGDWHERWDHRGGPGDWRGPCCYQPWVYSPPPPVYYAPPPPAYYAPPPGVSFNFGFR